MAAGNAGSARADSDCMRAALGLAARGLGDTWPNPAVGCVIVNDGVVVGRGWTQSGGRPHAETEALRRAGSAARGATAYVSLEPCSHHGRTPPCADALIDAGIRRVVSATTDPDPRVSGQGLARLRAAGVEVVEGVHKSEADRLNAGFFRRVTERRPLFALKLATSLDGRIAVASGESKWITGEDARRTVQALRAAYDAILVGSQTVLDDDPELTCRLDGYAGRPKVRIILDRRLRTPSDARVVRGGPATWIYTTRPQRAVGAAEVICLPEDGFLAAVARDLGTRGLTRVLAEGGGEVAASLLRADLVDEAYWFRGGQVLGGDGRPAVAALALDRLANAPRFAHRRVLPAGGDFLEILER